MKDIIFSTIPHSAQRYDTAGDYIDTPYGAVHFAISKMGSNDYEFMVALHEFIEWYLCQKRGITNEMIDEWDMTHPESDDPGTISGCPYIREHAFATLIERQLCTELGIDWETYEAQFDTLIYPKR